MADLASWREVVGEFGVVEGRKDCLGDGEGKGGWERGAPHTQRRPCVPQVQQLSSLHSKYLQCSLQMLAPVVQPQAQRIHDTGVCREALRDPGGGLEQCKPGTV